MSDNLDIKIQASIDQSSDAISKLKTDVSSIEKKLKDTKLNLEIELNDKELGKIANQFADVQAEVEKLKSEANFSKMNEGLRATTLTAEQMSATIEKVREEANLISQRTKFDLITEKEIQKIRTYQDNLLEVRRIIESVGKDGKAFVIQEDTVNKLQAQKTLYNDLKSINNEILSLEKQKIKLSDTEKSKINQQQKALSEVSNEIYNTLTHYKLISPEIEKQIELAQQLKQTQIDIAKVKDTDSQSRKAYAELTRLAREEFKIKQNMVGVEGNLLDILKERLNIVLQAKDGLQVQVKENALYNEERHNELLRERDRLQLDLLSKEEKLAQKEALRIEKLNEKVADLDFNKTPFYDDQAIKNYVLSLQDADAQITKFNRKITDGVNRQVEMTVTTQVSADKFKEMKVIVDENSKGLYKLSEAYRDVSNRNLSFIKQMGIAIERSIQWALSMQLLYGNIRKFREGIEIIKELDKELTAVSIITGKTKEETKQLALEYAQLGREMGKTVKEISQVNTELIRQGLSAEESYERMQTILKLSATGALPAKQTMSIITTSVNALGAEAERTADVLLRAGNISASSVEEIGEALTKTASSAKATGMTLEELSAITSALVEITGESPSSLGNSLKTLLARFNRIDEETGQVNETFNKTQEAIESVGVKFTDAKGQIRPFYSTLEELSTKWGDLDKNTQMYIATQSAGVLQQNRFIAIMDNFNRVQEIHNDLVSTGGELNQNYAKYLDSVEASANRARASFEEMWVKGLDSDLIKDYYEVVTIINQLISKVNVFKFALTGIVSILMLSNDKIRETTRSMVDWTAKNEKGQTVIRQLISNIKAQVIQMKALKTSTDQLGVSATTSGGMMGLAKAVLKAFRLETIATEIAIVGLQMALTLGLSLVITSIVSAFAKLIGNARETRREVEELANSVKANISTYQNNIKALNSMSDEYEKLNKKLGENKDFTKLTAEEQERYNSIAEQLAQIAPEIVNSYDEQGRAIINYTANIEDLIAKEKELIELEKYRLVAKGDDIVKSSDKEIKKYKKELDQVEARIELYKSVMGQENNFVAGSVSDPELIRAHNQSIAEQKAEMFKLNAERKVLLNDIDQERDKQRDLLDVYFMEIDALEGISTSLKQTAKDRVNQTLIDEGYDKAVEDIGKFQVAFEKMIDIVSNTSDIDETSEQLDGVRAILSDLVPTVEEVDIIIYDFINTLDESSKALEMVSISVGITSDEFKSLSDAVENLDSVFKKLSTGKNLSIGELTKLVDEYEEVAEYIAETGDITLKDGQLINEMREEQIAQLKEKIQLEQQDRRIAVENAKEQLKLAEEELNKNKNKYSIEHPIYKRSAENLKQAQEDMKRLNAEYASATVKLKALGYAYGETFRNADIENYASAFKEVTSQLDKYTDILKEMDKYGKLSGETNSKILENHPELIHLLGNEAEMRKYLVQLIDEQKEKQAENYKQSLMATEDFSKKVLNSNKTLFDELARIYKIDLNYFTTLQNFKAQMLANSTKLLSEAGSAYVNQFGTDIEKARAELKLTENALSALSPDNFNMLKFSAFSSQVESTSRSDLEARAQELRGYIQYLELQESLNSGIGNIDFTSKIPSSKKSKNRRVDDIELLTDRYIKFNKALEEVERSIQMNDKLLEYATGKDRINLLSKEIDLLNEKQKIMHLTANEERKEQEEIRKRISKTINLSDGTYGADSFRVYTQQIEKVINGTISQINATSNESLKESLTDKKDELKKAYDELKKDFDRYIELQSSIPELGARWWDTEFEKFNMTLEAIDSKFEKYAKRIENINDRLSLMVAVREDNIEEVEKEYALLQEISKIYEENLKDIEQNMKNNSDLITQYEKKIKSLGNIRNAEYQEVSRRLIMARAEQDKYFEVYQQNIIALADQQKTLIDKQISQINQAKSEAIKALQEIRKEMDGFDNTSFEISVDKILADLDRIDKIFQRGADFNLSTGEARRDLQNWKDTITNTLKDVGSLEEEAREIMSFQAKTQDELQQKKESLIKLIESQIGKENELKDLERDIRYEIEKTALAHQKIEDALQARIDVKQDELKQLQKQFEQEDRIKRSLEKQLEIMRAMDDRRYSYITGQGEEIFTYDQSRVLELQKEVAQMNRENERADLTKALQEEIAKLQEDLATTKEVNRQELEVLRLAQKGISDILGVLSKSIEDSMGEKGLEKIFEDMGNVFIDGIKEAMKEYSDRYEGFWERILSRIEIGTTTDARSIDKTKLGDRTETPIKTTPSADRTPVGKTQSEDKTRAYTVKPNDTLAKIAKDFNTTVEKIMELNPNIKNPNIIFPNQKVKVPAQFDTGGYTGDWSGDDGKIGILHKKELILNRDETSDILKSVNIADSIIRGVSKANMITQTENIVNNSDERMSVILNNPVFQGVSNVGRFANELNNLYRRGLPSVN